MYKKLAGIGLILLTANGLLTIGFAPGFGTFGFLVLINVANLFVYLTHRHEVFFVRHAYALTFSLMAILISVLSVFRASPLAQQVMGFYSIWLTMVAAYLYSLKQGNLESLAEMLLIPISLLIGLFEAALRGLAKIIADLLAFLPTKTKSTNPVMALQAILTHDIFLAWSLIMFLLALFGLSFPWWGVVINTTSLELLNITKTSVLGFNLFILLICLPLAGVKPRPLIKKLLPSDFLKNATFELTLITGLTLIMWVWGFMQTLDVFPGQKSQFLWYSSASFSDNSIFVQSLFLTLVGLLTWILLRTNLEAQKYSGKTYFLTGLLNQSVIGVAVLVFGWHLSNWYQLVEVKGVSETAFASLFGFCMVLALLLSQVFFWLSKKFYLIKPVEFMIVTVAVFIFGFINQQQIIATIYQPKSNNEINYRYLSTMSADAPAAWISSYNHVVTRIDQIEANISNENNHLDVREMGLIMTNLVRQYQRLVYLYGSLEAADKIFTENEKPVRLSRLARFASFNLAEFNGYRALSESISIQQLLDTEQRIWRLNMALKNRS